MADGEAKRSKKQKKQRQTDELRQAIAPDNLPERLQQQHTQVTCGADVNLHVRPPHTCMHAMSC